MTAVTRRLALLALLLGTACGSTVSTQQQVAGADGLGGASTSAATSGAALTGGAQSGALDSAGSAGATTSRTGSTGGTTTGGPAAVPTQLPGIAKGSSPVEVGVLVVKDLGQATEALGYKGLSTGDGPAQARASVALLNKRGGLAGHPVTPVIFEQDPTKDATTQYQAACSSFFDDHKVRAVVAWGLLPLVQACSEKAGVPFVTSGNRTTSLALLRSHSLTAVASQLSLDRMIPAWIASLKKQSWFAPASATEQVKVGLIFNEDNDYAQVPQMVNAALGSVGEKLSAQQSMPGTDDTSKVGAASSSGSNAALKFASLGVNRVLTVDKSGQAIAYFAIAAQSQGYYPRYGLSSLELPSALRTVLSARQLQGAAGIGWIPSTDVPSNAQPPLSVNGTACVKAMVAAQQDMTLSATRLSALATCDGVLLLGSAWTDPNLVTSTFFSGLSRLGAGYAPVTALADDFTSHRDGASAFRPLAYGAACDCFAYTAAPQRF